MAKNYKIPEEILIQLIKVSVAAIGKEKTYQMLGLNQDAPPFESEDAKPELKGTVELLDSFDEGIEFIVTHVRDATTIKSGTYLLQQLDELLIPFDELPEIGYIDDCLVLNWYLETESGFSLVISGEEAVLMQKNSPPHQLHVDEELVEVVTTLVNHMNYKGIVH